jgi:hypothetical protein
MSNHLLTLTTALAGCEKLLTQHPNNQTLHSIKAQLMYLIDLVNGTNRDRGRLKDIIIGVQTVREIEQLDDDVAELFHRAATVARII